MPVTPDSPWRTTGDTTVAGLVAEFHRLDDVAWVRGYQSRSPLIPHAAELIGASRRLSRLLAAQSFSEQKHAMVPDRDHAPPGATLTTVVPNGHHNFLSLKLRSVGATTERRQFDSYAACAAFWADRILNPDGPYGRTVTIRDFIEIYAPADDDNDVERYAREVCAIINRLPAADASPMDDSDHAPVREETAMEPVFGNVSAPPVDHRDIPPSVNWAFDRLGPRSGLFVVLHRMYGSLWDTDTYFRNEARGSARTDYGVDQTTGEILRWTDPLGDLTPWASGPWTAPPGDGLALVAKLGLLAINRHGISIEVGGIGNDPVGDPAFRRIAELIAFWADWNGIAWSTWPINPKTGLTFMYWHGEFNGDKGPGKEHDCPGRILRDRTTELIELVRGILREAQTGQTHQVVREPTLARPARPDRPPRPTERPSAIALPHGVTLEMVSGWFGHVTSNGDRAMSFGFEPEGPVSGLWVVHGKATGEWPQLLSVTETDAGMVFRFDGGWSVIGLPDGVTRELTAQP